MPKYNLLEISVKQPFANQGIMQRVPYTLPAQDDDVNWLEGFTDAYQRPVIADLGQQSGRYIRMGQLNQILNTTSGAILKIKQGLDNISEAISGSLGDRIQEVIKDAETAIKTRPISWLKTSTNQNCAGLKNFTGVNDNNFGTSLNAVANLKYCNGLPIQTSLETATLKKNTNYTCTYQSAFICIPNNVQKRYTCRFLLINGIVYCGLNEYITHHTAGVFPEQFYLGSLVSKKQVFRFETGDSNYSESCNLYSLPVPSWNGSPTSIFPTGG